ncbi:MAG TPA: SDR family NAD(P)-dependent oxidoreductase, partial [Candidatus Binatia bacterium]|nr:SDR family NAD(P)-dependent oxidoreductase [Candidatus Binatia bacterium]
MKQETCIVTGGNSGIGKATATALARMGHKVVIVSRDVGKGEAALAELRKKSNTVAVQLVVGNLDNIETFKTLATALTRLAPEMSVLINTAGVWMTKKNMTSDGL